MKTLSRFKLLIACVLLWPSFLWAAGFTFIVHPDLPYSAMPKEDVKNMLLGYKTKWNNGTVLKLCVLSAGPVHEEVAQDIAGKTADQFEKFWKRQVFTGNGVMPMQAKTEAEMVDFVAKNPGALGYVAEGVELKGVKVLKVK